MGGGEEEAEDDENMDEGGEAVEGDRSNSEGGSNEDMASDG